uniref:Zinc finger ZZ-type containing 3 n=1 Tax=Leptobrachium leishanense TaxID=445787 RepID=A0A8C5PXJ0_9ANUR
MAASRSTRVTRSTVGLNSLDETFCGRTLRNRSIAHPDDVIPPSLLRSRSPKKKSEQTPTTKGSGTKSAEVKHPGSRESWVSPRKRGLSLSEKDNADKNSVESGDKKQTGLLSPVLKKIKCYLRSEEPSSPTDEESPGTFHTEEPERKSSASDNETDSSRPKRALQCLLLEDTNRREAKGDFTLGEQLDKSVDEEEVFNHETVNGINDGDTAASNCNDCQSDGVVKLKDSLIPVPSKELIVSENGGSLSSDQTENIEDTLLDHNVPCSGGAFGIQGHKPDGNCLPNDHVSQSNDSTDLLSTIRDSEEEVDVVGDSVCKEHADVTSPGVPNTDQDHSVSGEPDSELSLSEIDSVASQGVCFSETQEHRYTLRTSPRRNASAKDSPSKCDSPWRENGLGDESKLCFGEPSGAGSTVNGSLANSEDVAPVDKPQVSYSVRCPPAEHVAKPSSQAQPTPGLMPSAEESVGVHAAEEDDDDPDVYFFESDHVALKHNKDYQRLLQTISVLEAQRNQAVQDLETLSQQQREAMTDPIGFVEMLQKKMNIGIPYPQRIVQVPEIAWDQYTTTLGNFERELRNRKRHSRRIRLIYDKVGIPSSPQRTSENKDGESTSYSTLPQSDRQECSTSHLSQQIRGRVCVESKPGTFNLLWTVEEQVIKPHVARRQLNSEMEQSLPNPFFPFFTKASSKRQHSLNKHLFRPSTFMTSHEPPVYMDEDEDANSFNNRGLDGAGEEEISDEEDIPEEFRELEEYKQLLELKKLKKEKMQEIQAESGFIQHLGFKCDNCETEPIQGVRWHCQDCPQQMSVDFCDSCSDCLYETELHKEDHELQPIYKAETFLDRDYCMPHGASYNYLDPNYFPANR